MKAVAPKTPSVKRTASSGKNWKRRTPQVVVLIVIFGTIGMYLLSRGNAAPLSHAQRVTSVAGKCMGSRGSHLANHDKTRLRTCEGTGTRQPTLSAASGAIVDPHPSAAQRSLAAKKPRSTATPTPTPTATPTPTGSATPAPTPTPTATQPSGAVMGFDEAGVSAGIGNDYTASQWTAIKDSGFDLFITDPIDWSSECSDGNCDAPVNTCTIDPAAVAQIQDAYNAGMDYAVYTRNVNCLTKAITGLDSTLQAHLSFAVLDIETGPSVELTPALVNGVTALGQTPVIYSYQGAWESMMSNTTAYDQYALQNGEVANWNLSFPAPYPAGFPEIVNMPNPYGGWSGTDPEIEQVQANAEIGNVGAADDGVDIDAVDASWLDSLPHQN